MNYNYNKYFETPLKVFLEISEESQKMLSDIDFKGNFYDELRKSKIGILIFEVNINYLNIYSIAFRSKNRLISEKKLNKYKNKLNIIGLDSYNKEKIFYKSLGYIFESYKNLINQHPNHKFEEHIHELKLFINTEIKEFKILKKISETLEKRIFNLILNFREPGELEFAAQFLSAFDDFIYLNLINYGIDKSKVIEIIKFLDRSLPQQKSVYRECLCDLKLSVQIRESDQNNHILKILFNAKREFNTNGVSSLKAYLESISGKKIQCDSSILGNDFFKNSDQKFSKIVGTYFDFLLSKLESENTKTLYILNKKWYKTLTNLISQLNSQASNFLIFGVNLKISEESKNISILLF